ncbi:hypothetical protein ACW9HH_35950 [Nocardia gipuzkoensis]
MAIANADEFTHWEVTLIPPAYDPTTPIDATTKHRAADAELPDITVSIVIVPRSLGFKFPPDDPQINREMDIFLRLHHGLNGVVTRVRPLRYDPGKTIFRDDHGNQSPVVAMLAGSVPPF